MKVKLYIGQKLEMRLWNIKEVKKNKVTEAQ